VTTAVVLFRLGLDGQKPHGAMRLGRNTVCAGGVLCGFQ
jgi:hypothetical protein